MTTKLRRERGGGGVRWWGRVGGYNGKDTNLIQKKNMVINKNLEFFLKFLNFEKSSLIDGTWRVRFLFVFEGNVKNEVERIALLYALVNTLVAVLFRAVLK